MAPKRGETLINSLSLDLREEICLDAYLKVL